MVGEQIENIFCHFSLDHLPASTMQPSETQEAPASQRDSGFAGSQSGQGVFLYLLARPYGQIKQVNKEKKIKTNEFVIFVKCSFSQQEIVKLSAYTVRTKGIQGTS